MAPIPKITILAAIVALVLGVMLIVSWFMNREQIRDCTRLGLRAAAGICGLYALGALLAWAELLLAQAESIDTHVLFLALELTFNFLWAVTITAVGSRYALMAGLRPFPLILPGLTLSGEEQNEPGAAPKRAGNLSRTLTVWVLAIAAASGAYSLLVFSLFSWEIGAAKLYMAGVDIERLSLWNPSLFLMLTGVTVVEELTFRLAIQNQIARLFAWTDQKYWLSILLTSLLWTFLHAGAVDPDWVKFVQIFPMGLVLGWMFRRFGIESCIAVHVLFNLAAPIVLWPFDLA